MAGTVLDPILQRASIAAVIHDADLEILEWNAGAERLLGFSAAEAVGKKIPTLLGSKNTPLRKDRTRISCRWEEERLDDGRVLAIVVDITQYKIRESVLQVMMDNLSVVVWKTDTKGVFTFHDGRKALEVVGLKPGQVVGQDALVMYKDTGAEIIHGALGGKLTVAVNEFAGQSWQSWTLPSYDEVGELDGAVGISLDVTDSRKRERDLQEKLDLIEQQQQTIRQLSIPLIETWENVLTVPMVGVVDSQRASEVMERLLTEITSRKARFAILDLTGVDEIDTDAAAHIIGLARAIRLLGAEGIITGIRPSMAQAMVQLGVDLTGMRTLANLREALRYCISAIDAS